MTALPFSKQNNLKIKKINNSDLLDKIIPLVASYQNFYETEVSPERNWEFFSSLIENPERGIQFGAFSDESEALGFSTLYFPLSSLSAKNICVLYDLFTVPEARGKGVGRALIEQSCTHAKGLGFSRIEWLTKDSNHTAQKLYDSTGAKKSAWFSYELLT